MSGAAQALAGGDPSKAASISISLGSSKSQSNTAQTSDSARGSTVKAGGNVNIVAQGAGGDAPSWFAARISLPARTPPWPQKAVSVFASGA